MLIKITDSCKMECLHCFDSCKSTNKNFMTMEMFKGILSFYEKLTSDWKANTIIITGGEPTEHPLLFEFIEYFYKNNNNPRNIPTLLSNGMFLEKESYLEKLLSYDNLTIQITHDNEFYKKKIKFPPQHPRIYFEQKIAQITPIGNAENIKTKLPIYKNPKCFNFLQVFRYFTKNKEIDILNLTLKALFDKLHKFCTPYFDWNGKIKIGEFNICKPIGNIYDPIKQIEDNVINFECNNCKFWDNIQASDLKLKNIN